MPRPFLIVSQSDYLILIVDINLHTEWQTVQIQISWLPQNPTDLDLHCLQRQGISGFSRTRVKSSENQGTLITQILGHRNSLWSWLKNLIKEKLFLKNSSIMDYVVFSSIYELVAHKKRVLFILAASKVSCEPAHQQSSQSLCCLQTYSRDLKKTSGKIAYLYPL